MPGLQELVSRNRGVSVYSPTRALPTRTTGGRATAGTARQILGGGQPLTFDQGRPQTAFRPGMIQPTGAPMSQVATPLGQMPQAPIGSPGAQRPQSLSVLDNLLARQQQEAQQPEGPGGFLGTVVNSLPGKMIMGALDVMDRPRRLVVSGVQELVDAVNGGDASFDDFVNQFNDPSFGFGDIIGDTGNIWANRVIGFVGDVLLDPTTYIMGGGVISGVGGKFRVGAAARAAAAGVDENIVGAVGRYGYSGLDDVARRQLAEQAGERVLRRGMHWKVPFMEKYLHLPGTGVLDRLVGSNVTRLRARLAETGPFTRLRQWMAPEGLEAAYEKLITGRGAIGTVEAAELITFRNAADRVGKTVLGRLAADAARVFKEADSGELNALLTRAETEGGTAINAFFDRAKAILEEAGVRFDARKYYVPHIYTDAATDFLKGTDPRALQFKQAFKITGTDPEDLSPVLMERKFLPRDEPYRIGGKEVTREVDGVTTKAWEGGREFKITTGTIEEMNAEFARVFPELGFKLLDDDITSIIARYSKSVYDSAGAVGGMKALLNSKGRLLRAADDDEASKMVVDAVASKHANKSVQDELQIQLNAYSKIAKQVREDTLKGLSGIQGVAGVQLRGLIDELASLEPGAKQRLDELLVQEQELSRQVGGARYRWVTMPDGSVRESGRVAGEPGELQKELQRQLTDLHTRYDAAERERARIARQAGIEKEAWQDARAMAREHKPRLWGQEAQQFKNWQEFQRLSRESAQLAIDIQKIGILQNRLKSHEATAGLAERLVQDNSFINQVTQPEAPSPFEEPLNPLETRVYEGEAVDPDTGLPTAATLRARQQPGWKPGPTARRLVRTVDKDGRLVEAGWKEVTEGGNPAHIREQHQLQRSGVIGDTPQSVAINDQIDTALRELESAEAERIRQASIHTMNIQQRLDDLERWQTVEAELLADIENLRGVPKKGRERGERIAQLEELQRPGGTLDQSRRMYEDAKRPVDEATERVALHQRELDRAKTAQMRLARELDRTVGRARPAYMPVQLGPAAVPQSALPGTYALRQEAGQQLPRLRRARERFNKSKTGKRIAEARGQSAALTEQLRDVDYRISRYGRPETVAMRAAPGEVGTGRITGRGLVGGSPFSVDDAGNVTLRYNPTDVGLRRVINERDGLIPEVNTLRQQYDLAEADWDDALRREAAGEAVDLPVAERAMNQAGLQLDAAQRELDALNMRIARWDSSSVRRARELEDLLKQRQGIVKQQSRIERTLQSKAGKRADYLDDEVGRLERTISEWDEAYNDALRTQRRMAELQIADPTAREKALQRINASEHAAISNVRKTGHRFEWERVPVLSPTPTRPGLRVGAYDFDDRVKLEQAYKVIHERKSYPRAPGGAENSIVTDARRTIAEVTQRQHRITLADALAGETVYDQAMVGYRAIDQARTPLKATDELLNVLADVSPDPGGATGITPRAKLAYNTVQQYVAQHGDEFVARGALYPSQIHKIGQLQAEFKRLLDLYAESPLPHLRHQIEQLTADIGRWGDFMISYKSVLDAGIQPSDQLATFLVERQLFKEQEVLEAQINRHRNLIKAGGQAQIESAHALEVLKYEYKFLEEQELTGLLQKRIGGAEFTDEEVERLDELLRERNRDPATIDPQKEYNRARDRMYAARRTWETKAAERPEFIGLMSDDVDALTFILREGIIEVDDRLADVAKARGARKVMQWPKVHKAELDASIPIKEQQYAEMMASHQRLRKAIEDAEAAGSMNVSYIPWRSDRFEGISINDAKARLGTAPEYLREGLRQRIAKAEASTTGRVPGWTEYSTSMIPKELHIDEARANLAANAEALTGFRASLDDDILSRDVLDGTAQRELEVLRQRLADFENPPDASALKRVNRHYNRLAKREDRALTPKELRQIEVNQARIADAEQYGPPDPELPEKIRRQVMDIQQRIDDYVRMAGGNGEYLNATIDDGAQFFQDLIDGVIEPTANNMRLLREFLGAEEAEYARGWLQTIDRYLMTPAERAKAGFGRVGHTEMANMFADIKRVYGNQELSESVIHRGMLAAERRRAEAIAPSQLDPEGALPGRIEEAEAAEAEFSFDAIDIPEVKAGMLDAMVAAAKAVSKRQTAEFMEMVEILGIRFGPDIQTASGAMTAMGYRMGRAHSSRDDFARLRKFVIDRLSEAGYTPTSRLEDYMMHLRMRRARLETMRRSLGAQLRFLNIKDPPEFFRLLDEAWSESSEGVVAQARRFDALVMPEDMATVLNNRISGLEDDLVAAVARGDSKAMDDIARQINELNAGNRPLPIQVEPTTAPSPTAAVAEAAPPRQILPVPPEAMAPPGTPPGGWVDGNGEKLPPPKGQRPTWTNGQQTFYADPNTRYYGWGIRYNNLGPTTGTMPPFGWLQGKQFATAEEAFAEIQRMMPQGWLADQPPPAAALGQPPPGAAQADDIANVAAETEVAVDEVRGTGATNLADLDEQIANVEKRLSDLARFSTDRSAISDWSGYPQPKPPTFDELLANPDPNKPPGLYSRAEVQSANAEMERMIDEYPDDESLWTPDQAQRFAEVNQLIEQQMVPRRVPEGTPGAMQTEEGNWVIGGPWKGESWEAQQLADAAREAQMGRNLPVQYNFTERGVIEMRNALEQQRTDLLGQRNAISQRLVDEGVPTEGQIVDAGAEQMAPSTLEEPTLGDAMEGASPPPVVAPDEARKRMTDETIINDNDLEYDELVEELDAVQGEYREYLNEWGSFEAAPQEVKQTMLELAARARKLTQLQKGAVRRAQAADRVAAESALPNYAQYLKLRREKPVPSVSAGWRHVMMEGTPSANTIAQMRAQPIPPDIAAMSRDEVITALQTKGNEHMRGDLFRKLRELEPGRWRAAHPVMKIGVGARTRWSGSSMLRGSLDEQQRMLDEAVEHVTLPRAELVRKGERAREAAEEVRGELRAIEESRLAEPAREARRNELAREIADHPSMADLDAAQESAMARYAERARINEIQRGSINLEHRRAMQEYNEQLGRMEMQLADVRKNIMLASDDYNSIRSRREQITKTLSDKPNKTEDMRTLVSDLRDLNAISRTIPPIPPGEKATPETMPIADIEAMLVAAERAITELEGLDVTETLITKRLEEFARDAGKGTIFGQVMKRVTTDGWSPYAEKLMRGDPSGEFVGDAVVIADTLANAMKNLQNAMRQPETWNLVSKYTAFFKTYATARPGFHVRNAMSAVFMNMVANVRMRNQIEAPGLWRAMMRNPDEAWRNFTDRERRAFSAVWGSGAAGQFEEVGTGTVTTGMGRAYRKLMNNAVTHWNRRTGAAVEGTARLAMALDAVDKGITDAAILDRIRQYHFDYTQLSRLDRTARQLIPFWTFMSRNLPLQISQFMLRPRTYQHYRSFVRNFSETADPLTPEYWLSQGVFTMDPNAANEERPWYLAPDLPHLRVTEPFEQIAQGRIGAALLSNVNPLYLAPVEAFGFGKKVYTDAPIDNEYSEPTWMMERLMPLFRMLGGTETTGSGQEVLDERYAHLLRSLVPPVNTAERMTIGLGSAESQKNLVGRQGETWARFFGAPVYRLTPELREAQRNREYFQRKEQLETQAELARM